MYYYPLKTQQKVVEKMGGANSIRFFVVSKNVFVSFDFEEGERKEKS